MALLPVVGFEFLKMYFTSQNLEQKKLLKVALPEKKKPATTTNSWAGSGSGYYGGTSTATYNNKDDGEMEQ